MTREGGCFCGALRYRFTGVLAAGYCHCTICRRTSGAPVMGWVNTPRASFVVLAGTPRFTRTSQGFQRAFCERCGTHCWSEDVDPGGWENVSVHHGTIDGCGDIALTVHIWASEAILQIADGNPSFPADLPRS